MTPVAAACPVAAKCPLTLAPETNRWGFTVSCLPQPYMPGQQIKSPGSLFLYEILSAPLSQIYWDFKGNFYYKSVKKLLESLTADLEAGADPALVHLAERYLLHFSDGQRLRLPMPERVVHALSFLLLLELGLPLWVVFSLCCRPMPHQDNNYLEPIGGSWLPKPFYPATYWVKLVDPVVGDPILKTIRW